MNAPYCASLGAMGSLLQKLDKQSIIQDMPLSQSIQQLRDSLASICSSLEKLSKVNDPSLTASYWIKDARELSYDTEDFLDQCFFLQGDNSDARVRFMDEISGFQARVEEVADRYDRYKIEFILSHATNIVEAADHFRIMHRYIPIGMENLTNALVEWIKPKDDDKDDNQLKVASILGVQGVGKTTLAQKLWNDESGGKFECRAFVQMAKKPDMRMILLSILSQVLLTQTPEAHDVQNLIQHLRRHLQDKRYFIIVEDLWSVSVWDVISCSFPDGNCSSRVLITTTIEDVALACCSYEPEHVFQMKPLGDDHSKQLFVDRVFGTGNGYPPQFNTVLEEITRKCGGLPLAIICIASHIASQPEKLCQWEQVQNFLCHNLRTNPTPVKILKQAFNLCYNSLPQCLKTCLLYLSVYPENYLILKDDLLKQWMAEDFICSREEENIFEVACSYFNWLVSLGLIQRMDINCNKKAVSYVVHPMLFEFITCKSTEDNFITIIDYSQSTLALSDMIRRLSVHFGSATYASMPESIEFLQVRTLTFMGLLNCMPSLVKFKLVRVIILHLRGDDVDKSCPLTGICGLLLLRYLQVKCNATVELPQQLGCLKQLETLEINSRFTVVPSDIFHLSRLLNVRLGGKSNLTLGHDFSVKVDYSRLTTPPVFLQRLELLPPICIFSKLPEWIAQLPKLCILEIVVRKLRVNDIDIIAELPALRALCLYVRTPTAIVFSGGEFLALEYFKFFCGKLLLDFQEKTMPKLRKLKIGFNAHRGMEYDHMLHGIQHLLNLQKVAARIGAATGAEESDRRAAEFAFKNTIRVHQCHQSLKVKRVGQVDEVCGLRVEQNWSHQKESSHREGEDLPIEQHGVLGEMATEDTKKEANTGGVDNMKRQFVDAEEHYNKGERGPQLQRKHVSLPRERVLVSKDGDTKQHTYEQRSADSIARTLVSPTRAQDAGNISSEKSETSASKYQDPSIYPKGLIRMVKPLTKCEGPSMDPLTMSPSMGQWNAATIAQLTGVDALRLIGKIRLAVRTASQNRSDCDHHLARRVDELAELLTVFRGHPVEPEAKRALAILGETLVEAHDLSQDLLFTTSRRKAADLFRDVGNKIESCLNILHAIDYIGSSAAPPRYTTTTMAAEEGAAQEFSLEEITAATNDFAVVLGDGDSGTVNKGRLHDGRDVATKLMPSLPQLIIQHLGDHEQDDELLALDALQGHVADRLSALSAHTAAASSATPAISLPFLTKLLDAVLSSDAAFRAVLAVAPVAAALSRPPAHRLAVDLLDRAVKTLDVLNAANLTLSSLRAAHRTVLPAASCLLTPSLHRGHLARARRAIARLFPDDTRDGAGNGSAPWPSSRTMRVLSFSEPKNWSAGRHMNTMAAHLAPPPQAPVADARRGVGLALYTMSSVLVFAMWVLVAAVSCQDRASAIVNPPVAPPKQAQWAAPMSALQDRIAKEWRRREKKESSSGPSTVTAGLLAEMQAVERAARGLNSLLEEIAEEQEEEEHGIVGEERAREVTERAEELAAALRALENGLAPLERQVRTVFHRVMACRAEVVRCIDHTSRAATAKAATSASSVPPQHHQPMMRRYLRNNHVSVSDTRQILS